MMTMIMTMSRTDAAIPEIRPSEDALSAPLLRSRPELGWVGLLEEISVVCEVSCGCVVVGGTKTIGGISKTVGWAKEAVDVETSTLTEAAETIDRIMVDVVGGNSEAVVRLSETAVVGEVTETIDRVLEVVDSDKVRVTLKAVVRLSETVSELKETVGGLAYLVELVTETIGRVTKALGCRAVSV